MNNITTNPTATSTAKRREGETPAQYVTRMWGNTKGAVCLGKIIAASEVDTKKKIELTDKGEPIPVRYIIAVQRQDGSQGRCSIAVYPDSDFYDDSIKDNPYIGTDVLVTVDFWEPLPDSKNEFANYNCKRCVAITSELDESGKLQIKEVGQMFGSNPIVFDTILTNRLLESGLITG